MQSARFSFEDDTFMFVCLFFQDNQVNPNVYNALDAYAKKVLTTPTSALKQYVNPSLSDVSK